MKKLLYIFTFLMLTASVRAQVTLNFESGNASTDEANGWSFYRNTYSNSGAISGTWSAQTYSLRNSDIDSCWIKSPWIVWNSGNITFHTRLRSTLATFRAVAVRFIPFDNCALNHEGTPSDTLYYNVLPINTSLQSHSFAVPSLVQDGKRWRMIISFLGSGGSARNLSDNYVLPGTLAKPVPTGSNVYNGNVNLYTQADVDAFVDPAPGINYLSRYTKVNGNLRVHGGDVNDPITCLANLRSLTEVTGHLLIEQFEVTGNPASLSDLGALTTTGRLTIITNPKFMNIDLPNLTTVNGALIIRNNIYTGSVTLPKLSASGGSQFMIARNHRAQDIKVSNQAAGFSFTNQPEATSVLIFDNGIYASNPVSMDFNKITVVQKDFLFSNNSNSGIANFDNIFSALDTVYGTMTITSNSHLSKCCVAASTVVIGGRTINSNTGNCLDLAAVSADCGTLNKRGKSRVKPQEIVANNVRLSVYPSPNEGSFNLEITSQQPGNLNLSITDVVGREVYSNTYKLAGSTILPLDLPFLAEGQYFIKTELNGQIELKRVMIAH